jgi:hypothetical protein
VHENPVARINGLDQLHRDPLMLPSVVVDAQGAVRRT